MKNLQMLWMLYHRPLASLQYSTSTSFNNGWCAIVFEVIWISIRIPIPAITFSVLVAIYPLRWKLTVVVSLLELLLVFGGIPFIYFLIGVTIRRYRNAHQRWCDSGEPQTYRALSCANKLKSSWEG
ncbi:hypothetical protein BDR04DRAFT_226257 [Suillus decipiens]|nr:hypothetical protein BDR04DRAFT_226257 [Suillus decipiens]